MRSAVVMVVVCLACGSRAELDGARDAAGAQDANGADDGSPVPPGDDASAFPASCDTMKMLASVASDEELDDVTPDQIVVDGGWVYFSTWNAIWRVPRSGGGGRQRVVERSEGLWPNLNVFTIEASRITFVGSGPAFDPTALHQVSTSGGAVTDLVALPHEDPLVVNAAANGFYVWGQVTLGNDPAKLFFADANGQLSTWDDTLLGYVKVIDEGSYAIAAGTAGVFVLHDGQPLTRVSTLTVVGIVDDGSALFATGFGADSSMYSVWRLNKDGTSPTVVVDHYSPELLGIATDGASIYFVDRMPGSVVKVPKSGGATTVMGAGHDTQALGVTVDEKCVYWTAYDDVLHHAHVYVAPR